MSVNVPYHYFEIVLFDNIVQIIDFLTYSKLILRYSAANQKHL